MADPENKADNENMGDEGIPTANSDNATVGIGGQIGRYKLLRILGEGGYGIVYLAEQQRPIKRRVALKVIKPGMDTKQVIARFEAERQALALLDHPNIAHVYDAGSTESGRPYFVMEYFKGTPITEYCDHHKLKIEERLKLFIQVCEAVQYAHQKGIIHRDIKPSNIVVDVQDGKAIPKVIDFGVAKAISMPLTEKTMFTQQGQLIGTPEYISPEQADLREKDIDTRTDIYSLGVTLYELLAGTLPFEPETLREAGFAKIQQVIREQEPPRPSTKLSSLGENAKKVAQNRHIELSTLVRRLHKELEWIPLMAIRKDRNQRYKTASDLAADVQNYLEGNPLVAGPESGLYRFGKFIKKRKGLVAALATISALTIASLVVITTLYLQAEKSEKEAITAKTDAEKALDEVERQSYYNNVRLADTYRTSDIDNTLHFLDSCPVSLRGWEWNWLYRWADQQLLTIDPNQDNVLSVCFSPDGKRIASGSDDESIKIWDADTGTELRILIGHQDSVTSVYFSPDGKWIASGSDDESIKIWDADTGLEQQTLSGHQDGVTSVCFSPDGKWIASGSDDKSIKIWDADTGLELQTLSGHQDRVTSVCFSPDGKQIASGSDDKTIKIWNADTGLELRTLSGHQDGVTSVCFSPDGKQIASGSYDDTTKVWNIDDFSLFLSLNCDLDWVLGGCGVSSVCFSPDSKRIV